MISKNDLLYVKADSLNDSLLDSAVIVIFRTVLHDFLNMGFSANFKSTIIDQYQIVTCNVLPGYY